MYSPGWIQSKGQRQSSLGMHWVLFLSSPFRTPLSELVGSRNTPKNYLSKLPNKLPGLLMGRICTDLWPWSLVITKPRLEWKYCMLLLSTGSCQWWKGYSFSRLNVFSSSKLSPLSGVITGLEILNGVIANILAGSQVLCLSWWLKWKWTSQLFGGYNYELKIECQVKSQSSTRTQNSSH